MTPTDPTSDKFAQTIINAVLKILRGQRDDKQQQFLSDIYVFNPQIFQYGVHHVAGPIAFRNPFINTPSVTFGAIAQKAVEDTTIVNHPIAQGYIPAIIYPYVYGFTQAAGVVDGFYLGLYTMTPIPPSINTYTVTWHASGKASVYPQQRIDEAWTSSYNQNEAPYLVNDTGQAE